MPLPTRRRRLPWGEAVRESGRVGCSVRARVRMRVRVWVRVSVKIMGYG